MVASATVRVMSPEEIVTRAGGETAFLRPPERASIFAERQMRLRQHHTTGYASATNSAQPEPVPGAATVSVCEKIGAGDEIRTHDPNLGKVPHASSPCYPALRYSTILFLYSTY